MSVVIGMHFGSYALLCADTRTTLRRGGLRDEGVDDDSRKVSQWSHGLVSGSGLRELLDAVRDRWQQQDRESIVQTEAMIAMIDEERARIRRWLVSVACAAPSDVDQWIQTTGWLFTYGAMVNGAPRVRLAMIHPSLEPDPATLARTSFLMDDDSVLVLTPSDLPEELRPKIQSLAEQSIRPMAHFDHDFDAHYGYHLDLCAVLVAAVAEFAPSVSSRMLVGVHNAEGGVGISEMMDCSPIPDGSE